MKLPVLGHVFFLFFFFIINDCPQTWPVDWNTLWPGKSTLDWFVTRTSLPTWKGRPSIGRNVVVNKIFVTCRENKLYKNRLRVICICHIVSCKYLNALPFFFSSVLLILLIVFIKYYAHDRANASETSWEEEEESYRPDWKYSRRPLCNQSLCQRCTWIRYQSICKSLTSTQTSTFALVRYCRETGGGDGYKFNQSHDSTNCRQNLMFPIINDVHCLTLHTKF